MRERDELCEEDPGPCREICDYEEKKDETGKIREIIIKQVNYGYIVKVGCHTFAIESSSKLSDLLNKYLLQPIDTEKSWHAGTLLK
jgi:hypothetical protein